MTCYSIIHRFSSPSPPSTPIVSCSRRLQGTASAYEEASAQNARLVASLVGKDEAVTAERAERAKV